MKEKSVQSKRYIIISGLHAFYLPQMRNLLDLKIYMDTNETLRRFWKIQRDMEIRGYTKAESLSQIEKRMSDANKYIYPQKGFADLTIAYYDEDLTDCMSEARGITLNIRIKLSTSIDIEPSLRYFLEKGLIITQEYDEDLRFQTVCFDGASIQKTDLDYRHAAEMFIPQMGELFRDEIHFEQGQNGLLQFFLLLLISCKMRGDF